MLFIPLGLGLPFSCSGEGVLFKLISLGGLGRGHPGEGPVLPVALKTAPNSHIGLLYFLETPQLPGGSCLEGYLFI